MKRKELNQAINDTPIRGYVRHNIDDNVIIETRQDVTDIIEDNNNQRKYTDKRTRWGDDLFDNKIASIPLTVFDELNKRGIVRGFQVIDQKAFKKFLNDPDNRVFRTREGIV
jgi:hypothetical protein